jgi:hypothetical protein
MYEKGRLQLCMIEKPTAETDVTRALVAPRPQVLCRENRTEKHPIWMPTKPNPEMGITSTQHTHQRRHPMVETRYDGHSCHFGDLTVSLYGMGSEVYHHYDGMNAGPCDKQYVFLVANRRRRNQGPPLL